MDTISNLQHTQKNKKKPILCNDAFTTKKKSIEVSLKTENIF